MRHFGKGFNFGQDGPGNRLVYHLSGCNMRCLWCSNPNGFDKTAGNEVSVEQLVNEAISCKPMFFSGGGVTFTGGEATLWHDELLCVLKALKQNGIHTALETNGTDEKLHELLDYVDYLFMDFKHYDTDAHKRYTGLSLDAVKHNFEKNCLLGRQQHIRLPLINGVNTDSPEKFAEYFKAHDTKNTVFEFLAYHEYGKEKWQTEYQIQNGFVSADTLKKFKTVFESNGLTVVMT